MANKLMPNHFHLGVFVERFLNIKYMETKSREYKAKRMIFTSLLPPAKISMKDRIIFNIIILK